MASGIEGEVPLAFLRHSTSKIKSVEDLFTVSSLGFRVRPFPVSTSVAQVELIRKTSGFHRYPFIRSKAAWSRSYEEVGGAGWNHLSGATICSTTPARQKFLKAAQTEGKPCGGIGGKSPCPPGYLHPVYPE